MKVYIGYDTSQDIAYQVCKSSILKYTNVEIIPLVQQKLREQGIYTREVDPLSSTEFTFTRFLVPYLNGYKDWAIFVDSDFLFTDDISNLFKIANDEFAVMVVKHNYNPESGIKMNNKKQFPYPRKNWSSLILWNCGHPSNIKLSTQIVNEKSGSYLHRFNWLNDNEIGEIDLRWNWLVNWYTDSGGIIPKAIHYTEGGPWLENYKNCEYADLWVNEKNRMLKELQ
jgi:lipopolysaccharide biosynthesis glycosyltransferase